MLTCLPRRLGKRRRAGADAISKRAAALHDDDDDEHRLRRPAMSSATVAVSHLHGWNVFFDAGKLAQLLKVVGTTVAAAATAAHHSVTKMERADSEGAMVVIATLESTSLNDGDLEQMAMELLDTLAMTVKDDALTIIQGTRNLTYSRHGDAWWLGMLSIIHRRFWWQLCESRSLKGRNGEGVGTHH